MDIPNKRGRKPGLRDWCFVKIADLKAAGISENFALKINRKWLIELGLKEGKISAVTVPETEPISEKKDKINFEVHEPEE